MDATSISQLDDPAFRELITTNIHHADDTKPVWELLSDRSLAERTLETLRVIRTQAESAMSRKRKDLGEYQAECLLRGPRGRQDWLAEKRKFDDWKRRANNFRRMVEGRQVQVKARMKASIEERAEVDRSTRITLAKLCLEVQRHQAAYAASGRRAEQADYELWSLLDELTIPFTEGGEATLRDMLRTHWTPTERDKGARRRANERLMKNAPAGRSRPFEGTPKARHVGSDKLLADD
ncbi:MAG TPA: hypothetical protein VFF37_06365 [Streptomyces sp.]|nr:hypothetical protein [Planctomycetota bacterium]HZX37947.1 hypothetical protein [Streptomyces sp.]